MKQIRILNIVPVIMSAALEAAINDKRAYCKQIEKETDDAVLLETRVVEGGSAAISCAYDAAVSMPYVLKLAQQAQMDGFDAIVLDCFTDTALGECRELLRLPVVGPCQSGCFLAMRLGGDFSIICLIEGLERSIKENLARYGIKSALKSMPMLNIPASGLSADKDGSIRRIVDIGQRAVREDGAKALVFGYTGLFAAVKPVSAALREKGVDVPVIDPFRAAVFDAISCVMAGVTHSKAAYMPAGEESRS